MLRAVNVGGTGKLEMSRLREIALAAGLENPRTYIASGNLVFTSAKGEKAIKDALEDALEEEMGKKVSVIVRCANELAMLRDANPFFDRPSNRVMAIITDGEAGLDGVRHQTDEELKLGERAVYVHYPLGMGHSKLAIPASKTGTVRNLNTIAKLAEMAKEAET